MITVTEHTIDIDNLLLSKMGNKVKYVPRFLVIWLKNLIHQDEVNSLLWEHRDFEGVEWVSRILERLNIKVEVKGEENLPGCDGIATDGEMASEEKHYTFCSNHPMGGADGMLIAQLLGRHYNGKVRLVVNDLLMNLPGLAPLCVPVNTVARKSDRVTSKSLESAYKSDNEMFFFPAGLCSRKINGEIHDLPWRKTFITKSVQHHRDVIPMYVNGRNSERFYRIANLCKMLHSPVNVAMLYLADELFANSCGKTFTITVGKPISWQTFDKSKTPAEWAQYVQDEVYRLAKA